MSCLLPHCSFEIDHEGDHEIPLPIAAAMLAMLDMEAT